ncbi:MAG: murein biosynthesis integral membrane protein MurJ [Myxococcota bacterium]
MSTDSAARVSRSAGVVAVATMASRVLGLVRDSLIAYAFPVAASDAFFVAFTIPNLFRRLVGEGSLTLAFVPIFSGALQRSDDDARRVFYATWTLALLAGLAICLLGMWFADPLVVAFAPGYSADPVKRALTGELLRLCFPYIVSLTLVAVAMGALNVMGHFFRPAIAPVFLNLTQIVAVFAGLWFFETPIVALAWGVVAAGLLQVLVQLKPLRERGFAPRLLYAPRDPAIQRLLAMLLPSIVGASAYQLNTITTRAIASFFGDGPVSYMYYATRLMELPLGVFVFGLATSSLPLFARQVASQDRAGLDRDFAATIGLVLALTLPCTAGLVLLRDPIVSVLFGWNPQTFGAEAVRGCGLALLYYGIGLVPIGLARIWVNLCIAHHDTRTGAQAAVVSLAVNVAAALTCVGPLPSGVLPDWAIRLQHSLVLADFGYLGVALATSLAAVANAAYVIAVSRARHGAHVHARDWAGYLRLVAATVLLAAVLAAGEWLAPAQASVAAAVRLALLITVGGVVYLAGLWLFRAPEFALVAALLRRALRIRPSAA